VVGRWSRGRIRERIEFSQIKSISATKDIVKGEAELKAEFRQKSLVFENCFEASDKITDFQKS